MTTHESATRRIMALDIGDRWIGVALSDPGGILATPLLIIDRTVRKDDVNAILEIVHSREVGVVVVGLPRAMDGTIRQQAEKVQQFVRRLSEQSSVPIELRDERLSTVSAGRLMRDSAGKRSKRHARDDAAAAAIILQGYLDERRLQERGNNGESQA